MAEDALRDPDIPSASPGLEILSADAAGPRTPSRVRAERFQQAVAAAVPSVAVEAGHTVVRQGDEGRGMYVVASGALDVVITTSEGVRLPVARLGPGTHFGEMSLLTGSPVSADVVAVEASVLHAVTVADFDRIVRQDRELMECLAVELGLRLRRTDQQLAELQQRQSSMTKLLGSRPLYPFHATLPRLSKTVASALAACTRCPSPLLLTGEPGVGKRALAQYLHSCGARAQGVVLTVDCSQMPPEEAISQLFGDGRPEALSRFAERLGYLQAADHGTLILANVEALPSDAQAALAAFLSAPTDVADAGVSVCVIMTAAQSLEQLRGAASGPSSLWDLLGDGDNLALPALRDRRRDIIPLAEHFLDCLCRRQGVPLKRLDDSARRALLNYDFRFANVEELRQVVELAVSLTDGEVIGDEHLFFGPLESEGPSLNLLRHPTAKRLLVQGHLITLARLAAAAAFAGITAACLLAPRGHLGHWANLLVWAVWWPVLIVSFVLLGRVWCAVCPLSSTAGLVQRLVGREWKPPEHLKFSGPLLALLGFIGIISVEHFTHMGERPTATAFLLIGLAAAAALTAGLFQRDTWCRYLCPLGAMGAMLSILGGLRIRATREVCSASCTGNECYRGSGKVRGCPMFNHALYMSGGQYCKFCLDCLRSCPSNSPTLVLQPPLRDIWRSNLISADTVPMAVTLALVVFLMALARFVHLPPPLDQRLFGGGALAVAIVGVLLTFAIRHWQSKTDQDLSWSARLIFAYAPSVAAVLLAFHLHYFPGLSRVFIGLGTVRAVWAQQSLLQLLQIGVGVLGGLMTWWSLWRLSQRRHGRNLAAAAALWVPLALIAAAWVAVGIYLLH